MPSSKEKGLVEPTITAAVVVVVDTVVMVG